MTDSTRHDDRLNPPIPHEQTADCVELLRRHVVDWGTCDHPDDCVCSHDAALRFLDEHTGNPVAPPA